MKYLDAYGVQTLLGYEIVVRKGEKYPFKALRAALSDERGDMNGQGRVSASAGIRRCLFCKCIHWVTSDCPMCGRGE